MFYEPMDDILIIRPLEKESVRESGLVIPDSIAEKQRVTEGEVVSAGPGRRNPHAPEERIDMVIGVGDRVVFPHFSGNEIEETFETEDGRKVEMKLRVIRESEILFRRKPGTF